MKEHLSAAGFLLSAVLTSSLLIPNQARASKLIDFRIKDQFHQYHQDEDYQDKILVIIGSDKHGSDFNSSWGQAIHDSLENESGYKEIEYLAIADVRGVPFFLKGHVRKKFPRDKKKWALVDWKGRFAKVYDWEPKASNILIFDCMSGLSYQTHATVVEPQKLREILRTLRGLLKQCVPDSERK